ncbi:MAG: ABC transporter ATP-binding protein [Lachnospiraceae bacterium]|nr:ABC transporter ATP-binding protein [Lachnospiraceae bacterium]
MGDFLLSCEHIEKSFGATRVLCGINLHVRPSEFITLLGPSGCGKTTLLRIIAGLEYPDEGKVILDGVDMTPVPPHRRSVGMVFQNYALFPHMNVEANVGYSLRLKGVPKAQIREEVAKALHTVALDGYGRRLPSELSGGQSQRVAIARAIIGKPRILLLDEPLGALDLQLRRQMQIELKHLQKQLSMTFIYITHDQEEALTMSDRIAVMKDGRFQQTGDATQIYDAPETTFVAQFVGNANILRMDGRTYAIRSEYVRMEPVSPDKPSTGFAAAPETAAPDTAAAAQSDGTTGAMAIAALSGSLKTGDSPVFHTTGTVTDKSFAGGQLRINARLPDGTMLLSSRHGIDSDLRAGMEARVSWDQKHMVEVH